MYGLQQGTHNMKSANEVFHTQLYLSSIQGACLLSCPTYLAVFLQVRIHMCICETVHVMLEFFFEILVHCEVQE